MSGRRSGWMKTKNWNRGGGGSGKVRVDVNEEFKFL